MRLKKVISLMLCTGLCASVFYIYSTLQDTKVMPLEKLVKKTEKPAWISDKPIPETVQPGAYLAAMNAVFEEDLEKAADYYLKALEGDRDNPKLLREAYFFNSLLRNFDVLRPVVDKMPRGYNPIFFMDYLKVAFACKENRWAEVRQQIKSQSPIALDDIVHPLLLAWSYAGEENYAEAVRALDMLKKKEGMESYYFYHKGLIAMMLGQQFAADEAFQALAQKPLPTFSFYPEIRSFYVRQGAWQAQNPFYLQWQLFAVEQSAAAELIMQTPSAPMTANRGIAEVFYNMSTALGSAQNNYESALILGALSSYINPNQELPKIWSAELLEKAKKPYFAAYFYADLKNIASPIMDFKRAMNLLACHRESEAKDILLRLKPSNQGSAPLWWALASVYQNEKNWPAAIQAYTHLLKIEDESNRSSISDIYFARAFVYGEQKELQKAESDLLHALELNPENPMLLNHLGYLWLEDDKNLNKGVELVKKAYQLKSSDPYIMDSMAFAYYRQNDYEKALPLAEKTVDIMPQSSVANAHLGDIYGSLGRYREAVFQYQKALSLKYDLTPELKQELLAKVEQCQQKR